jgi:hypothetical protein
MKNLFIASGLTLVTALTMSTSSVLGQTKIDTGTKPPAPVTTGVAGDDGTVIESEMVSIITGDGNRSTQKVKITSSRERYFDAPGNDGTVIRSYVSCDIMGNDNVCEQYKVIKTRTIRAQRPSRTESTDRTRTNR